MSKVHMLTQVEPDTLCIAGIEGFDACVEAILSAAVRVDLFA
jgi:hypothetical protein